MKKSFMYKVGYKVAKIVFSDDYYKGKWFVTFQNKKRICGNYTGAQAWANYLERKFGSWSRNNISTGKVTDYK